MTNAAWLEEASNSGAIATAAKCLVRVFIFILLLSEGFILFQRREIGHLKNFHSFFSY